MNSISRGFLIAVGATSVLITLLSSVAAFCVFRHDLGQREQAHMAQYTRERFSNLSMRFIALSRVHSLAVADLSAQAAALDPQSAQQIYDLRYPRQADGTRRSRPQDFDGHREDGGHRVGGMGAYLSPAAADPVETATMAAAFDVVQHVGEGVHSVYDNVYFATPGNKMVMFAPDRPDRLMFYRKTAPPNLDFSHEDMLRIVSPAVDPQRATRCTSLQRLIQDTSGRRLATACMTPVYVAGRYVGAFGSSMSVADMLSAAVRSDGPGMTGMVLRGQGDLLSFPGMTLGRPATPQAVAEHEKRFGLARLLPAIKATGRRSGLIRSPDGRWLVGYGHLEGPDWYVLMAYPRAAVEASAFRSALWVLGLGLAAAALQTALILVIAHRKVVDPLRALAASCTAEGASDAQAHSLARRDDELGVLARALATERENARLVMASLEHRVRERTAELERAGREKSRFLANVSHELRTPLNAVVAVSEGLAARQSEPEARRMAELVVDSGRRLERVLSDVLDVANLDSGDVALELEAFDLAALAAHACALHAPAAHAKGLELTCTVAPEARGRMMGDPDRIGQVLARFLGNAVKFTDRGWVALRVERSPRGELRCVVTDTGIGFDEATKAQLFHHVQTGDSQRDGASGTGLGLAVCRALAEAMGGQVGAASRPGVGSMFEITLPLAAAPRDPAADGAEAQADAAPPSPLHAARVLLAEDHPLNRKVVALMLQDTGAVMTTVESGAQALHALAEATFDVVLMDSDMPERDGLSAVRELRRREAEAGVARTPVILLTPDARREHAAAAQAAGADHHLPKPIRAAELLALLEACLLAAPPANERLAECA